MAYIIYEQVQKKWDDFKEELQKAVDIQADYYNDLLEVSNFENQETWTMDVVMYTE